MTNTDLHIARTFLENGDDTFIAVKNGDILYRSQQRGIQPYFDALDRCGEALCACAVADRLAGKAAVHLALYIGAFALYTPMASGYAIHLAEAKDLIFEYERRVPHILNRKGDFMCPMEEAVLDIEDSQEAFVKLRETLRLLREQ
ncbi:MAG: DUF1893 domain-containing protein [Candidatus Neomarinimicrobiota bacterium]|jgi:hypothetical protein|nr:DUF1893 domain-containing protein [Candidatus Neomarinimicrobiota bacterium]MDD3966300.1 DUF1893 domain-containing protein [Candidatus Neomarinimicrobiota bacterium]MDX9779664.1 DUF1893 domain-containing protein [bacterium]